MSEHLNFTVYPLDGWGDPLAAVGLWEHALLIGACWAYSHNQDGFSYSTSSGGGEMSVQDALEELGADTDTSAFVQFLNGRAEWLAARSATPTEPVHNSSTDRSNTMYQSAITHRGITVVIPTDHNWTAANQTRLHAWIDRLADGLPANPAAASPHQQPVAGPADDAAARLQANLGAIQATCERHTTNALVEKSGTSQNTGKPWRGWFCPSSTRDDSCPVVWGRG